MCMVYFFEEILIIFCCFKFIARDAMITSAINCGTSFMSGFVVFSVLGHMCYRMNRTMDKVANEGMAFALLVMILGGSGGVGVAYQACGRPS